MVCANCYYEDFPNFNRLDAELDLWLKLWDWAKFKNNLPWFRLCYTEKGWLTSFPKYIFGLKTVWYFACDRQTVRYVACDACECEQSFSSLWIVKTWDCSTMANAIIYPQGNRSWCFWNNRFICTKSRRVQLKYL